MCLTELLIAWTKKKGYFKGGKLKNQERIDRFVGKCPTPQ